MIRADKSHPWRAFAEDLEADLRAAKGVGVRSPGLGNVVLGALRLGAAACDPSNPLPVRLGGRVVSKVVRESAWLFRHVLLSSRAEVGPGTVFPRPFNIVIGAGCRIGPECIIDHNVTFGQGSIPGLPRIGARVRIHPGARLLGGIVVGDDVEIGPNCVISRDIPSGTTVQAPPVRAVPKSTATKIEGGAAARKGAA